MSQPKNQPKYVCVECGAQAKKPALKAVSGWRTAPVTDFSGLGKWRCPSQRKAVKVRRVV